MEGKKFIVGVFIGTIMLLGGLFFAEVFEDKIVVTLPSDVCSEATLRVTKDDWTLKCGRRIAFQADTIVEYYKTYGVDEWVRNNRFVGRNKKDITLELIDYGSSFDVVKSTRYRKGRQSIADGNMEEIITFSKDKIKLSWNYEVQNKALHKISMRVKKQYNSQLDGFDINGHTGILINNVLSYQGYGDLYIDPTVTLSYPVTLNDTYREGDTIPFNCSAVGNGDFADSSYNLTNVTFSWTGNGSWITNGTTLVPGFPNASSISFSRVLPHKLSDVDGFTQNVTWGCEWCAVNTTGAVNCTASGNNSFLPYYKPHAVNISSPFMDNNLNLLNGTGWGMCGANLYQSYCNASEEGLGIYIYWTHPGIPDNRNVSYNLSYVGTTTTTRSYANFIFPDTNASNWALFNVTNLPVDDYYVTLHACNSHNDTLLCVNDTMTTPIEVFDYTYNFSNHQNYISFGTQPSGSRPALGQDDTTGLITLAFLGSGYPDGVVNVTLNYTNSETGCLSIAAGTDNNVSNALTLSNITKVTILNETDAATKYIWLWGTKTNCGTSDTNFDLHSEVLS